MTSGFGSLLSRHASVVSWQDIVSFQSSLMFAIQASIFSWMAFIVDLISTWPDLISSLRLSFILSCWHQSFLAWHPFLPAFPISQFLFQLEWLPTLPPFILDQHSPLPGCDPSFLSCVLGQFLFQPVGVPLFVLSP
jgi:hypothetical protein